MRLAHLVYLLPVLPFLGALLNGVVLKDRIGKRTVAGIACGTVGAAAGIAILVIAGYVSGASAHAPGQYGYDLDVYRWIPGGLLTSAARGVAPFDVDMGFFLDPLACVMLFVVTFVGFFIH